MAASSATFARDTASCMKVSAGCASCAHGPATRSSSPPTAGSSGFCLDPIEKKPFNHFLPGTAVLSLALPAAISPASSARTGISRRPGISIGCRSRLRRGDCRGGCAAGARSVAFTYNDPVIFLEYAVDVAAACRESGSDCGGDCRLHREACATRVLRRDGRRQYRSQGVHRELLQASLHGLAYAVLDTLVYVKHETKTWSRSPPCSFQARTTFVRGDWLPLRMDGDTAWARRAIAFHGFPSRLEDAGCSTNSAFHPQACP